MRRALIALLVFALCVPEVQARNSRGWENVEKVKRGTPLLILLRNGEFVSGNLESVSDSDLRVATPDRSVQPGGLGSRIEARGDSSHRAHSAFRELAES